MGGEDRRGTAEPLCIPSGSFSRRSRELAWWPPLRLGVNGGRQGCFSRMTASWGPNWCPAVPPACCTVIPGGVISGCPEPWKTF